MPPPDLETWMWAEACETLARAERLQRAFFRPGVPKPRPGWEPPIDIFENRRELWIVAALPGVEAAALEIVIAEGVLAIAGERRLPPEQRAASLHRLELPHGRFERRIALPPGRFELARRDLADGCLTLVFRKLA